MKHNVYTGEHKIWNLAFSKIVTTIFNKCVKNSWFRIYCLEFRMFLFLCSALHHHHLSVVCSECACCRLFSHKTVDKTNSRQSYKLTLRGLLIMWLSLWPECEGVYGWVFAHIVHGGGRMYWFYIMAMLVRDEEGWVRAESDEMIGTGSDS